jgi:O-antigen/teichoic acid export membrane protein
MTWIAPIAALLLMASSQTAQYLLDVIRLHMKPWRFFGVSLATRVATAIAGVVAVVWLGAGLDGLLATQATVSLLALPLAALAVRRDLTTAVDLELAFKLLRFGHPFIYSGIAFWLFGSIDRWLLAALSSVEEVGIYSVAHRFASVVMMVSFAFGQAWAPLALKARSDDPMRYRKLYADVLLVLACGMLVLGSSIAMFSRELISWLMPPEYSAAAAPLAILCLAVVLQSTTQVTAIGISLERKTSLFARLSWMTAGINVALNLLLIPGLGAIGAALATALSYLFLTGSYLYSSQALHPLPIRWGRSAIWFGLLVSIGAVVVQSAADPVHALPVWFRAALLVASTGACFVLVAWRRSAHGTA